MLAGHIDTYTGPAIFAKLSPMTPVTSSVSPGTNGLRVTFEVDRIDQYPKAYFPTDLVYGPTSTPELRLITCGRIFNQKVGSYQHNVAGPLVGESINLLDEFTRVAFTLRRGPGYRGRLRLGSRPTEGAAR